jgi:hypothetical protein
LSSHCWCRPERIALQLGRTTWLTALPITAETVRPLGISPQVECRPLPPFSVGVTNVGSRTPHRKFVVVLNRAAARSWYWMKSGNSGASSPGRLPRDRAVCLGGRDAMWALS